jgi:hypothetical protein
VIAMIIYTKSLPSFSFSGVRTYRAGELVEYTGEYVRENDGTILFSLVIIGDSYRVGAPLVTYTAPELACDIYPAASR